MRHKQYWIAALVIVVTLIATLAVYSSLPDRVPMHWNFQGQVDDYGSRPTVFLMPGFMTAIMLVFAALPWLSPKHFEVDTFRSTYLYIMVVIVAFMAYVQALMLWAALSKPIDMTRSILGSLFLLLLLLGNVMGKVRRNFYVGVRTPWTLANERVWHATHRFAGKSFVIGGVAGLVLVILGAGMIAMIVVFPIAVLAPVVYSLVYYKQLERRNDL